MSTETRIYVACLASYNNGVLHGVWIEDCTDADAIQGQVNTMLRESQFPNVRVPCPDCNGEACPSELCDAAYTPCQTCGGLGAVASAEEWAIHDHEGFGSLIGECTPFEKVAEHAARIEEHGEAWNAYCDHVGVDYATEDGFNDAYKGTWDSKRAFAENLVDELGYLDDAPDMLSRYFDYDAFARDLFIGDYWRDDDTGAVFDRNV